MASGGCVVGDKWDCFSYISDSGRYRYGNRDDKIYYHHWLPKDITDLLPPVVGGEVPDFYQEFKTLIHVTTLENALEIFRNGFKPRPVADSSVVNDSLVLMNSSSEPRECITPRPRHPMTPRHPISNVSVIWYGPCTVEELQDPLYTAKRYGNVVFSMKRLLGYEGLIDSNLNLYFIEVIEYMTSTACRILVTPKKYPTLRKYDPYTIGGPLYIIERSFYSANRLIRHDGSVVDNVLEIMMEECSNDCNKRIRKTNHHVRFVNCSEPRRDVENLVVRLEEYNVTEDDMNSFILQNSLKLAIAIAYLPFVGVRLLIPFYTLKKARDELIRVHEEAMEKNSGIPLFYLIDLCLNGVVEKLMKKGSIVDTYRDMLHLLPQHLRPQLAEEIWEKILDVFFLI